MLTFETKEHINKLVDAVYALTESLERGMILPNADIQGVLGVPPHVHPWNHVLRRVERRLLRERGIAFWPNHRDGKKLCTHAEQLLVLTERLRRANRQTRKGLAANRALEPSQLSPHQRRLQAFYADKARDARRATTSAIRAMNKQAKPPERMPRRVV